MQNWSQQCCLQAIRPGKTKACFHLLWDAQHLLVSPQLSRLHQASSSSCPLFSKVMQTKMQFAQHKADERRDHGPLLASSVPVDRMGQSRCHPGHRWTRTSPPTATQEALSYMQTKQPTAQCRSANELPGQTSKGWENWEKVWVEKNIKKLEDWHTGSVVHVYHTPQVQLWYKAVIRDLSLPGSRALFPSPFQQSTKYALPKP